MTEKRTPLDPPERNHSCGPRKLLHVKASRPFVVNDRGHLVHRPRRITYYSRKHFGVTFWCGMMTVNSEALTFVNDVDGLVCQSCEDKAKAKGLPSSDEITGHHVHIGTTRAVRQCCNN